MRIGIFAAGMIAALLAAQASAEEAKKSDDITVVQLYRACLNIAVRKFYVVDATAYEVSDAAHGSCLPEYNAVVDDIRNFLLKKVDFEKRQWAINSATEDALEWKERFRYESISNTLFLRLADKNKQQAKPAQ